jgi:predicted transcriptional regulator
MSSLKKPKIEKQLTEVELQLMNAVWALGDCTVKAVQLEIAKTRELAYTTIATVMKILEQKGILQTKKTDKAHLYSARISKSEYETTSLQHLANSLFQGDPTSMVMRLLNDSKLSKAELSAIQKIIDERIDS